jgi:hypothetical protein
MEKQKTRFRRPVGIEGARLRGPQLTMPEVDPAPERATINTEWSRWVTQLMTDLAQSKDGVALQGALPVSVGWDEAGRGPQIIASASAGRLLGYSFVETAGQAVTVHFHDAATNTPATQTDGPSVWHTAVAANGVRELVGMNVSFSTGLSLEFNTSGGQVRGVVLLSGVD